MNEDRWHRILQDQAACSSWGVIISYHMISSAAHEVSATWRAYLEGEGESIAAHLLRGLHASTYEARHDAGRPGPRQLGVAAHHRRTVGADRSASWPQPSPIR